MVKDFKVIVKIKQHFEKEKGRKVFQEACLVPVFSLCHIGV